MRYSALLPALGLLAACTQTTPEEVIGTDRITVDEAAAQVADAVKHFRMRLASDKLGEDATTTTVDKEKQSGLMFCGVDINFLVSAKATENGKLTLAVPATFNFAGPNLPLNTIAPTLNAERGGTSEANRSNTIVFKMVNPVCANYQQILDVIKTDRTWDPEEALTALRTLGSGNQAKE